MLYLDSPLRLLAIPADRPRMARIESRKPQFLTANREKNKAQAPARHSQDAPACTANAWLAKGSELDFSKVGFHRNRRPVNVS